MCISVRFSRVIKRSMSTLPIKPMRSASSLIIVAPVPLDSKESGSNYRILMLKRNTKSSFVSAHVYPGGVVDSADNFSHWNNNQVHSEKEKHILTNKICAIRETFEESGLLLSEPPADTIKDLDIEYWRHKVHDDASQFKIMCDRFNICPAVDLLVPFSNWITPEFEKRRYDTLFFITILNRYANQKEHDFHYNCVSSDGKENVLFEWLKPEEALEQHYNKKIVLIPPQWYSLYLMKQLSDFNQLNQAGIGSFRTKSNEIVAILPQLITMDITIDGYECYLAYPGDENYKSNQYISKKGNMHRLYFKGRMEAFKLERNVQVCDIVNMSNI